MTAVPAMAADLLSVRFCLYKTVYISLIDLILESLFRFFFVVMQLCCVLEQTYFLSERELFDCSTFTRFPTGGPTESSALSFPDK